MLLFHTLNRNTVLLKYLQRNHVVVVVVVISAITTVSKWPILLLNNHILKLSMNKYQQHHRRQVWGSRVERILTTFRVIISAITIGKMLLRS